jgi:hypothetical protein
MLNKVLPLGGCAIAVALAACAVTGCKSSGSEYISPRVEGRVLDSETHQPIYRVHVKRTTPSSAKSDDYMRKGAQRMEEPFPAYTDKNGYFVIDSEKALVLFAQMNWFSVDISFEHSGYDRFVTNYTLMTATNTASGEPLVNTGDVYLQRTQNKKKPQPL